MKTCPTCRLNYPSSSLFCSVDGARLEEADALAAGTIIRGKYRILEKVGEGGMGQVYKACHIGFDEPRALKIMNDELTKDPVLVERFKHEAFIARKLLHPNVVRVEDIDEAEDGRPFIVMEFIEGQSLKKVIESHGHLPVARVSAIVKQVAAALDAAHRLGMVHRDIKPDNIALIAGPSDGPSSHPPSGLQEIVKVLDFGIAKLNQAHGGKLSSLTLTGTGMVIGTAEYMSPEQAAGRHGKELDGRSDVYSLGVVMYQMLTGALPFKANTAMDMVLAHIQTAPTPIRAIRPGLAIPAPIAALVMKCLRKDRAHRPATAGEIAQALVEWEKSAFPVAQPDSGALQPSRHPEPLPGGGPRTLVGHPAAKPAVGAQASYRTPPVAPPLPGILPFTPPAGLSRAAAKPAEGKVIGTSGHRTRRRNERAQAKIPATLSVNTKSGIISHKVHTVDVSQLGVRLRVGARLSPGEAVVLETHAGRQYFATGRVAWVGSIRSRLEGQVGIEFTTMVPKPS